MTISNAPQGSPEWHEERHAKISGTRAKQLYVKSETLFIELLAEYTEPFQLEEDSYESDAMIRGKELEPIAREWLSKYTKHDFKEVGFAMDDSLPLLGMSYDGLTEDNRFACEIKCLGAKKHMEICLSNEIPSEHIAQCIHAFTINPLLEIMYFCAYRPEALKKQVVIELNRNTIVNIGTQARPKMISVTDAVIECRKEAERLNSKINKSIEQLTF